MALSRITSKRRRRRFLTYDLEWVPDTYELRLVGVYDGKRYRCYRSIPTFLAGELTSRNRGCWFYAHAGGLADMTFILAELQDRPEFTVECAFSGSAAIIVQVTRGRREGGRESGHGGNSWTFIDSLWLLKNGLADVAKWLGTEKGVDELVFDQLSEAEKKRWYAEVDELTLMRYNERDCVILWDAIDAMQTVIWNLGGQMQRTMASSAMHLFRRRFLGADIPTSAWLNERAEGAYFSARVEVLEENCTDAYYLDINSSFPYAMTQPQPGAFAGFARTLPDSGIYIADVTVTVPDMWFPPLCTRIKNRLFFPTGTWRSMLSSVDIELLWEIGGRVESVHEVLLFEEFTDTADYVNTIYEMRRTAESDFERVALKFFLNMLYGKFAEGTVKGAVVLNPGAAQMGKMFNRAQGDESDRPELITPGLWRYEHTVPVPHRHVPIAVHVTALARRTLYRYMAGSEGVHYCDTDGFSSVSPMPTTDRVGGLKLEKLIHQGHFVAPKCYLLEGDELGPDGSRTPLGDRGAKAKGFSRITADRWWQLAEGKAIWAERMYRIREQAARGRFQPGGTMVQKRLQNTVLPKRFHYPDGTTRPWHIAELRAYFEGNRLW